MAQDSGDLLARRPPPPIPVLVLTGFLGAGKTTLLNQWVRTAEFADAAVLINEFGEVSIDHLLVEKAEGTTLTLASGCLCCTIRGDLIAAMEDLIRRRDNGRVPPFNHLVIETTGLADPAPILNTLMFHPYLPLRYRIGGVVTVVDALHGLATLDRHEEARRQAAVADTLVLTKTDVPANPNLLSELEERLAALNPAARRLDAARGQATASAILGSGLFDLDGRSDAVRAWLNPDTYAHEAEHRHHGHHHDINRHSAAIQAVCLTRNEPLDDATVQMFLDLLRGTHGANLLRLKAILGLASDPSRPLVVHGVQHYLHPSHRLPAWPDGDQRTRMVVILDGLDVGVVSKLWNAFFGPPAIDQPDAAALSRPDDTDRGLFGQA